MSIREKAKAVAMGVLLVATIYVWALLLWSVQP